MDVVFQNPVLKKFDMSKFLGVERPVAPSSTFANPKLSLQFHDRFEKATMESLTETPWDVLISGTGLAQSLLAL